jgi:hypothetical protein
MAWPSSPEKHLCLPPDAKIVLQKAFRPILLHSLVIKAQET